MAGVGLGAQNMPDTLPITLEAVYNLNDLGDGVPSDICDIHSTNRLALKESGRIVHINTHSGETSTIRGAFDKISLSGSGDRVCAQVGNQLRVFFLNLKSSKRGYRMDCNLNNHIVDWGWTTEDEITIVTTTSINTWNVTVNSLDRLFDRTHMPDSLNMRISAIDNGKADAGIYRTEVFVRGQDHPKIFQGYDGGLLRLKLAGNSDYSYIAIICAFTGVVEFIEVSEPAVGDVAFVTTSTRLPETADPEADEVISSKSLPQINMTLVMTRNSGFHLVDPVGGHLLSKYFTVDITSVCRGTSSLNMITVGGQVYSTVIHIQRLMAILKTTHPVVFAKLQSRLGYLGDVGEEQMDRLQTIETQRMRIRELEANLHQLQVHYDDKNSALKKISKLVESYKDAKKVTAIGLPKDLLSTISSVLDDCQ